MNEETHGVSTSTEPPDVESGFAYLRRRVRRHVHWARTQGIGRLVEEDQLNPLERLPVAVSKWAWRRRHGVPPGAATPVFLVGVQRSGTNMLVRGLEQSPEFEVHNENDTRAFTRFRLRPDEDIAALVRASQHRFVLFKPLCDSHRTDELLANVSASRPSKAIWAYRDVDGRVRSALAKFGDVNLRVLAEIGAGAAGERWQAQRISAVNLELIRSFDYSTMTPHTAAALFWFVRNSLYFDLGLHHRHDVFLSSYDEFVAHPETTMRSLCAFLGVEVTPSLTGHIAPRSGPRSAPAAVTLDPRVREACDELSQRLAAAAAHSRTRAPAGLPDA